MAKMLWVEEDELHKFIGKMGRFVPRLEAAIEQNKEEQAQLLHSILVEKASGRPGPNVITGAYVMAFYIRALPGGWQVGNASPQTRRLEYGFVGMDSLGRNYNQGPFPHFRPAVVQWRPMYRASIASIPKKVWRGL